MTELFFYGYLMPAIFVLVLMILMSIVNKEDKPKLLGYVSAIVPVINIIVIFQAFYIFYKRVIKREEL